LFHVACGIGVSGRLVQKW